MLDQNTFSSRKYVISFVIVLIAFIFILRLLFIQVIDSSYKLNAENNVLRYQTLYPVRGLIYDRNGELMVYNEAVYNLMIIPRQVKTFDTLALAKILSITKNDIIAKIKKAKKYSYYKPSIFEKQISVKTYGKLQEQLYCYNGFFIEPKTLRKYPTPVAAHVLGNVGEVNSKIIKSDKYYKSGDYHGISGIENYYEKLLRGEKGVKVSLVDVHNRIKGSYKNGKYDTLAVAGKTITLSIDEKLQAYGEKLMQNKIGSIVAIEPSSGEILSLITAPSYDPNLLVGRVRSANYNKLVKDSLKPLFNRALMAKYPPGSIFKIAQALVGLQMGVITAETGFECNKHLVNCHNHPKPTSVRKAVKFSCNPYFYNVFKRILLQGKSTSIFKDSEIGLAKWHKMISPFGFGQRLNIDLKNVKRGNIPDVAFYDRWYGKGRWAFSTIYSLSIGQGEIEVVPLQMANFAATIANQGFFHTPHLLKKINGTDTIPQEFTLKHETGIDKKFYPTVIDGMEAVVNEDRGTARRARLTDIGITVCGKTGTSQNPHGEDHSVFIAFAPKENPKIAIAVYVENSGFGGTWAAPIASLMIEQYLTDSISHTKREQYILNANFIDIEKKK